jgi:hypothetical protein
MKSSCYFVFNHSVLLCPNLYSTNFHNSLRTWSILILVLSTACKRPLLPPINLPRGPRENTSRGHYPLSCDVTAYAEVFLPSRCLETGCITPLFYCCLRVLLSNRYLCGSTVRAWSRYATIHLFTLPEYDNNDVRFVRLEVCAIWKQALWILPGPSCLFLYQFLCRLSFNTWGRCKGLSRWRRLGLGTLARFVGVSWESQGVFTELNSLWQLKSRAGKNYRPVSKNTGISGDTTSFSDKM